MHPCLVAISNHRMGCVLELEGGGGGKRGEESRPLLPFFPSFVERARSIASIGNGKY